MEIIIHKTNGLQIGQRHEDGYINLTQMAQANGKKLNDYLRLETTKAFLDELSTVTGIPVTAKNGIIQIRQGGRDKTAQGTWGHPYVAINCGQWCSPQFAVLVSQWVFEWMVTGRNPVSQEPVATPTDLQSGLEELEQLIISIRSQARVLHTCAHQPIDELLAKSLHSLSHNQLSAIASAVHQMQAIKALGVRANEFVVELKEGGGISELVVGSSQLGVNSSELKGREEFGVSSSELKRKNYKLRTKNYELLKTVTIQTQSTQTLLKKKQFVNVNINLPLSQKKWLAATAQKIRDNNSKPVPAGERVYPQHLIEVAVELLQHSAVDLASAYSVLLDLDESVAKTNFQMVRDQQEWLTYKARTIRNNCSHPTLPSERVYPQHLIGVAIELLQTAEVDWSQVRNVEELRKGLNI